MTAADVVAELDDLAVHFPTPEGVVRAVDGVTLAVRRGETLGLVGESGSGKSTAGLALMRLVDPTAGRVRVAGADVTRLSRRRLRGMRRHVAMVFQDPQASLDPRRTVADSVAEPLVVHRLATSAAARRSRGGGAARVGRPAAGDRRPAPARAVRRPASAGGGGPRAGR